MTHPTNPMPPTRLHDWQMRFESFAAARQRLPFIWGVNDCATFAADCVLAMTGSDPAPDGLRKHRTAKQAARAMQRHGGLIGIATAALGQPVPVSQARVGDVLLVKVGKTQSLGICNGASVIGPSARGMVALGLDSAQACWRVA